MSMKEELRRRVLESILNGRITDEQISRAFERVREELGSRLPGGVTMLDWYLTLRGDEEGAGDLKKILLAPESETDPEGAEPGTPERRHREAAAAAARFAEILAEELGWHSEENTVSREARYAELHKGGHVRDDTAREGRTPAGAEPAVSPGPAPGDMDTEAEMPAPSETPPRDTPLHDDSTTPEHPGKIYGDLSSMSRAQLISVIQQQEKMLMHAELRAAELERRLADSSASTAGWRPPKNPNLRSTVDALTQRVSNLLRLNRILLQRVQKLEDRKKAQRVNAAAELIRKIQKMGGETTVAQLCSESGISRATAWRYVRSLTKAGLLIQVNRKKGLYRLTNIADRTRDPENLKLLVWQAYVETGEIDRPLAEPESRR